MSRPTKFDPELTLKTQELCANGATAREVAEYLEVSEATIYRWAHAHQGFREALKTGRDAADERVEQSLYRKAVGYTFDSVHISSYQGEVTMTPIVEHVPPDTTAAIFWLKNRKPAEWRDRVEHTGANGGPIETVTRIELVALNGNRADPVT